MVTTAGGEQWAALAQLDEQERTRGMREHLESVRALEDEAWLEALRGMVEAEYALSDEALRPFTASRLRVWAEIAAEDLATAQMFARGYDTVLGACGASMAMRCASMTQSVARSDLTPEQVEVLFSVVPSLGRSVPRAKVDALRPAEAPKKKAAGWKFWSR